MLRKKRRHFIPLVALTTTLLVVGCSSKAQSGEPVQGNSLAESLYQGQELLLKDSFANIKVDTDLFAVRIEPSADAATHIHLDTTSTQLQDHFDIQVQTANDELNVSVKGKKKVRLNLNETYKNYKSEVVVQLPEHDYKQLDLQSNVGKISFKEVNGAQLNISTDAGEIELENVKMQQAKLKNSVGLVSLHHVEGAVDVSNHTGAVKISNETLTDNVKISNDVGAVTVETAQEPEQFKLDLSTEVGNIETNWQADFTTKSRRTVQGGKGTDGPLVQIETAVGIIKVNTDQ